MLPENIQQKSFWEKTEGTTGMFVGVLLAGAALLGLSYLLPFLITIVSNTLYLGMLLAVLGGVAYVIMDQKFRMLFSYGYKVAMRWITGWFITIDPIGILQEYVERLQDKLGKMDQLIEKLKGQIRALQSKIEKQAQDATQALRLAGKAREQKKNSAVVLQARQAGRLKESNRSLQEVQSKAEVLYRVLQKMREASDFMIKDIQNEVVVAKETYEMITSAHRSMKIAQRIVQGDVERELFNQTMEYVAQDYGRKLGEIENFVDLSKGFIETSDLQNLIYEEDALKLLDEWEKKGDSILLGDEKASILSQAYDANSELDLDAPVVTQSHTPQKRASYQKLFENS